MYVMLSGRRVTLVLRYVTANNTMPCVVESMLAQLKAAGFAAGCLFMDRGFYSVRMVNMLKSTDTRFCMMKQQRGKTGGTRLLCTGKTRKQRYTVVSVRKGVRDVASFTAFVVCRYEKGKYNKHRNYYLYATYRCCIGTSRIYDTYRKRFGIESSFRQMNDGRIRTSTRDPVRRLRFVAIGMVLFNLWVLIKWMRISTPRKGLGGRKVHERLFQFETILVMLLHEIGMTYYRLEKVMLAGG